MNELKPCPFCGSDAYIYELKCGWYVDCTNDDNCSHNPSQQNGIHIKQDAINNWNTRAPQSEWISVADRVPSDNKIVSVCGGGAESLLGCSSAGYYSEVYSCFIVILESDVLELCEVTHWMPLPNPPKES